MGCAPLASPAHTIDPDQTHFFRPQTHILPIQKREKFTSRPVLGNNLPHILTTTHPPRLARYPLRAQPRSHSGRHPASLPLWSWFTGFAIEKKLNKREKRDPYFGSCCSYLRTSRRFPEAWSLAARRFAPARASRARRLQRRTSPAFSRCHHTTPQWAAAAVCPCIPSQGTARRHK
jgi:hypothetical protein